LIFKYAILHNPANTKKRRDYLLNIETIKNSIKSFFSSVYNSFDLRDILVFGGMASIGYGLYQYCNWSAFAVCGALLMLLGLGWLDRGQK